MENSQNLFNPQITEQMPNKTLSTNTAKISVIGVGGGGCNMVDHMIQEGIYKIDLIAANTDLQALRASKAPKKIQLGLELTKGLGAGARPEIGRDAAIESYDDIKDALDGSDIVFIAAGLGGGTGTGASSIVAKAANEIGALCVAVVTKPFKLESKKRAGLASLGLEELKKVADSIIVVKNEKLSDIIDKNLGLKDSFKIIDNILYQAVNGMTEIILNPGSGDINADFADISTIMQYKGMALMGIGKAKGEDAGMEALENAIKSPLLNDVILSSAKGMIVHWTINPNMPFLTIKEITEGISNSLSDDSEFIFGTTTDDTLNIDEVKITIIATGFEVENEKLTIEDKDALNTNFMSNLSPNDPEYYDTPPLSRDYNIKYQL